MSTCECGFTNSPSAKFCGGCGKSTAPVSTGRCSSCGHISPAQANFCENCSAPLSARPASPGPPLPPPPIVDPPMGTKVVAPPKQPQTEPNLDRRVGRVRVKGVVLSLQGPAMRIITPQHADQPIEVQFKLRMVTTLKGTLQAGDEVSVAGKWKDGLLVPTSVVNLRTGVRVLRQSHASSNLFILIVFGALGFAAIIPTNNPLFFFAGLAIGLVVMFCRMVVFGFRERRDLA